MFLPVSSRRNLRFTTILSKVISLSTPLCYLLFTISIIGIEWTQTDEFLSYAQTAPAAIGGWVRNEVMLTNVSTGKTTTIRADRGEESPIELLRVSPLKQYFIIVFKESPPELWDLRHLTLVRTLPKRFPTITTLEWMPTHLHRLLKKSNAEDSDSSIFFQPFG